MAATFAPGWNFSSDPTLTAQNLNLWAAATVSGIIRAEQASAFRLVRADNSAPGDVGEIAYSSAVDVLSLKSSAAAAGTIDDGSSTAPTAFRAREMHSASAPGVNLSAEILGYDSTTKTPTFQANPAATTMPMFFCKSATIVHLAGCVDIPYAATDGSVSKGEFVLTSGAVSGTLGGYPSYVPGLAALGVALKTIGAGSSGGVWVYPGGY